MLSDAARKKAEQAKAKGMWLYEPEYKWWYSPEEFMHVYHYANCDDELLARIQIRHPNEGIEAGFKRLTDIQGKLQIFAKRVMEYYKKKA